MVNDNFERAQTLVEALPYIQKFNGKVIVIKYGGNAMINQELFNAVMEDIILLHLVGIRVVLVAAFVLFAVLALLMLRSH